MSTRFSEKLLSLSAVEEIEPCGEILYGWREDWTARLWAFGGGKGKMFMLLIKYVAAANLCLIGWHESLGMIQSVVVDFMQMVNSVWFGCLITVISRRCILWLCPNSAVIVNLGCNMLNSISRLSKLCYSVTLTTLAVAETTYRGILLISSWIVMSWKQL